MKTITNSAMLLVILSIAMSATAAEHTKDSVETVQSNLKSGKAVLVDVREKAEWNEGHLKRAKLLPLSRIRNGFDSKELPKTKVIYCHCRSGGRTLVAAEILKEKGYDVRPLKLGFESLVEAGFEAAEE